MAWLKIEKKKKKEKTRNLNFFLLNVIERLIDDGKMNKEVMKNTNIKARPHKKKENEWTNYKSSFAFQK